MTLWQQIEAVGAVDAAFAVLVLIGMAIWARRNR